TTTAQTTHTSIRYALETANTSLVRTHDIDIFLQGSYRNSTNIRSDSDVDVVVQLNETYTEDLSRLLPVQREAAQRDFVATHYPWNAFRADVLESLRRHYGAGVVAAGDKAIKLQGGSGRLAADVIPAVAHRLYTSYGATVLTAGMTAYIEGIALWDQSGRYILNYPKEHIKNGEAKNAQ